jgi:hypothetical protein
VERETHHPEARGDGPGRQSGPLEEDELGTTESVEGLSGPGVWRRESGGREDEIISTGDPLTKGGTRPVPAPIATYVEVMPAPRPKVRRPAATSTAK